VCSGGDGYATATVVGCECLEHSTLPTASGRGLTAVSSGRHYTWVGPVVLRRVTGGSRCVVPEFTGVTYMCSQCVLRMQGSMCVGYGWWCGMLIASEETPYDAF
jgi:hypothetical protein